DAADADDAHAADEQELRVLLERAVPRLPAPPDRLGRVRERAAVSDGRHDTDDAADAADADDAHAADEQELRVLLERAVPRLPAPPDRLGRVRERAARGRRMRVAMGAAASVAGLALAGALLPGLLADVGTDAVPPATTPTRTDPGARSFSYPELQGLTLRLPDDWRGTAAQADPRTKTQPLGLAAPRPLGSGGRLCRPVGADGWCVPRNAVDRRGGALLALRLTGPDGGSGNDPTPAPAVLRAAKAGKSCVVAGGGRQFTAYVPAPKPGTAVEVMLCLPPGDTAARLDEARGIVASARFDEAGGRAKSGAPTEGSTSAPPDG
ncbi:hypothetical protein ABZV77_24955, partial [Streptomyces sp. NPDC004732]